MEKTDLVTISDDESASECTESASTSTKSSRSRVHSGSSDTIILDSSPTSQKSDLNDNVIERLENAAKARKQLIEALSKSVEKKSKTLAKLIETCLNLENSEGMLRVIQKTLLRLYEEADEDYKNSKSFERVVRKTLDLITNNPDYKFSQMKNLCDTLRLHRASKKVHFVALTTDLTAEHNSENLKRNSNFPESPRKKQKTADIILDSESDDDSDVISVKDSQSDDVQEKTVTPCIDSVYQLGSSPSIDNTGNKNVKDHEPINKEESRPSIDNIDNDIVKHHESVNKGSPSPKIVNTENDIVDENLRRHPNFSESSTKKQKTVDIILDSEMSESDDDSDPIRVKDNRFDDVQDKTATPCIDSIYQLGSSPSIDNTGNNNVKDHEPINEVETRPSIDNIEQRESVNKESPSPNINNIENDIVDENLRRNSNCSESPTKKQKTAAIILDSEMSESDDDSDVISVKDSQSDDVQDKTVTPCIDSVYQLGSSPSIDNTGNNNVEDHEPPHEINEEQPRPSIDIIENDIIEQHESNKKAPSLNIDSIENDIVEDRESMFHKAKKRANFVTLTTDLTAEHNPENLKRKSNISESPRKKQKTADIILDSESDYDSDVISVKDSQSDDVQEKTVTPCIDSVYQLGSSPSIDNTGNNNVKDHEPINKEESRPIEQHESVNKEAPSPNINNIENAIVEDHESAIDKENRISNEMSDDEENSLLIPNLEADFELECSPSIDKIESDKEIREVEIEIIQQKSLIKIYDEQEVTDDNQQSPYLLAEKAKAKIVALYQRLCALTGQKAVKRRSIRLQVLQGHPPEPTRKLEEFINQNIGKNGEPPFPDFCDVVACVLEASTEHGLGWNKTQVMKEASALFLQCGQALQKRRQRREYRDLCSRVKAKPVGRDDVSDPADEDPELRRKLEENRRIALRKENEILERYTMMQYLPAPPKAGPNLEPTNGMLPSASIQHSGNKKPVQQLESTCTIVLQPTLHNGGKATDNDRIDGPCIVKYSCPQNGEKYSEPIVDGSNKPIYDGNNEPIVDGNNRPTVNGPCHSRGFTRNNIVYDSTDSDKNCDSESETDIENEKDSNINVNANAKVSEANIKIKKEPVDVIKMLDELGDGYTSTIIEIQDPCLVIEISSDSELETHAISDSD